MAVETFDALVSERGDSGKIWASTLKQAIKRRKPDFNESYYGFRAFGNLLEEAQARGLLELGRDEKSGAYVYRSSGRKTDASALAEQPAAALPPSEVVAVSVPAEGPGAHEPSRRRRGSRRIVKKEAEGPLPQVATSLTADVQAVTEPPAPIAPGETATSAVASAIIPSERKIFHSCPSPA